MVISFIFSNNIGDIFDSGLVDYIGEKLRNYDDGGGNNNNKHLQEDYTEPVKEEKKRGTGILEGLHSLVKHNYVKGIFALSFLFMVGVTIIDYTMKVLVCNHFDKLHPCNSPEMVYDDIS